MNQHQLIFLILGVVVLAVIASLLGRVAKTGRAATLPYERIERLFTPAERSFLGVLEQIFGSDYRILGKVRLADIIRPRKGLSGSERTAASNRVSAKHVDFAICDLNTLQVIGVVELDDSSHDNASRRRRDEFCDAAFTAAGVPVAHVRAQKAYNPSEVRQHVLSTFGFSDETAATQEA